VADAFRALILDNEVTVGEFVRTPPLSWTRLINRNGKFQAARGYPALLTDEQAKFEMRNWDEVSVPSIMRALPDLTSSMDYVVFGNNAGQGLPLAQCLSRELIENRAAIIYADSLPETEAYRRLGYQSFFRRSEAVDRLRLLANGANLPLSLWFINTIQHDEFNYHEP
jgi:hypothetical protein